MKFIENNKTLLASGLALAVFVFAGEYALASIPKTVELNIDETITEVETQAKTVEELLLEKGYQLDNLQVLTELDKEVKNKLQVVANTQKDVLFENQGQNLNVTTYANSVEDFLAENNITVDSDDILSPELTTKLTDSQTIRFDDVVVENYTVSEEIAFTENVEYSFDHDYGYDEVETPGVNGSKDLHMIKTIVNDVEVSNVLDTETVTLEPVEQVRVIGTRQVVEKEIERDLIENSNSSMYKGETNVIQAGSNGIKELVYENKGGEDVTLVSERVITEPVDRIVEYGTKTKAPTSPRLYSLRDLQFHGVIRWGGYKFTYYSQQVLPGGGLRIPGRHINAGGYVADGDGYIVIANDAPKGTIINTPFGYKGKVYDRGTYGNHMDVYTR